MAQKMTKGEFIDKMWDQCSSKLLKSGCILSYLVTVHQLRNHDCEDAQGKRDLLAGMLFTMGAEDNPLQIESRFTSCEFARQLVQWTTSCRKCTRRKFTSSQILFYVRKVGDDNARNQVHREHLTYFKDTARKIDGEQVQFAYDIFLGAKTIEIMLNSDEWI